MKRPTKTPATPPRRKAASEPAFGPLQIIFDATPEIFATDNGGSFTFDLVTQGGAELSTAAFDEVRFLVSVWHPGVDRAIDLDRAYVELRASVDPAEDHWIKLAEIEPVVPAYASGESFDGWVVLPVMSETTAFALYGSGFEPRARLQIRASAFFVT